MTDAKRLKDKLAKLASGDETVSAEGRVLSSADLRSAILDEIDETMLPRLLTFVRPDGEALAMEVSGRRLLRIVDAPARMAGHETLTEPLVADSADQLARVAACLGAFGQDAASLTVRSDRLERRPDPSNVGRSAAALAAALGIDLRTGSGNRPVSAPAPVAGSLEGLALAAGHLADGTVAPLEGAPAPGALAALQPAVLARLVSELAPGERAALCFRAKETGLAVVITRVAEDVRVFLVPGDRMSDALLISRAGAGS